MWALLRAHSVIKGSLALSQCSKVAWGLNQVCLEFAGSSGTTPIKPKEEQPIDWKRQSVSTASLGSHIFGTLE